MKDWDNYEDESIYGQAQQGAVAVPTGKQVAETSEDSFALQSTNEEIYKIAEEAEKRIRALNTIMNAALKITTEEDWVITGGKPYLQATGATKVARLFGIEWKLMDGFPRYELKPDGHRVYEYRMKISFNGNTIEMDGARSSASPFFTGSKDPKGPAEIDMMNVQKSAFANCLNRGIKALIPGLQGINQDSLVKAGFDLKKINGYTFKEGNKGGKSEAEKNDGLVCADCGKTITQKVASYTQGKFGRYLCFDCQKGAASGGANQLENKTAPKAAEPPKQKKPYEPPKAEVVQTPPKEEVNDEEEFLAGFDQFEEYM